VGSTHRASHLIGTLSRVTSYPTRQEPLPWDDIAHISCSTICFYLSSFSHHILQNGECPTGRNLITEPPPHSHLVSAHRMRGLPGLHRLEMAPKLTSTTCSFLLLVGMGLELRVLYCLSHTSSPLCFGDGVSQQFAWAALNCNPSNLSYG
jgi:hypothetical protein